MAVGRGEHRIAPDDPKVWFTSTKSFAKVLSAGNCDLLRGRVRQRVAPRGRSFPGRAKWRRYADPLAGAFLTGLATVRANWASGWLRPDNGQFPPQLVAGG